MPTSPSIQIMWIKTHRYLICMKDPSVRIFSSGICPTAKKVTHNKKRLLDQEAILFNCLPFRKITSLKSMKNYSACKEFITSLKDGIQYITLNHWLVEYASNSRKLLRLWFCWSQEGSCKYLTTIYELPDQEKTTTTKQHVHHEEDWQAWLSALFVWSKKSMHQVMDPQYISSAVA